VRDPDSYRGARRNALRDIRRRHYFDRIIRSFQKPKVAALGPWAGAWAFFNAPRPGVAHQIGVPPENLHLRNLALWCWQMRDGKRYDTKGKR
jgi:hypothetical protein